ISRKRRGGKQVNDMRTTLRIGDEVMTIGGIVGTVIEVNERSASDKDFVIETGAAGTKSTMLFDLRALHENRTRIAELREEAARQAEIDRINKENKRKERDNRRGKMS
ncbi:MAG: preprotein translocase subunit YajC, partial [Firmicutes bacterium]|nr:preprotein translocase subunit YajC [Bacillota bacterium]